MTNKGDLSLTLTLETKGIKTGLEQVEQGVKKLGEQTKASLSTKDAMGVLGSKSFAEVKAEMAKLTQANRDLSQSGKLSSTEQAKALESLRQKQRELYATISNPPKLDLSRSVLGISSQQSIVAEINKVKQAYASLASSGKANLAELTREKVAMGRKIDELKRKTNGWRDALGQIKGRALEAGAAGAGLVLSAKAAIDFESAMANVKKVVDGTPEELAALGKSLQGLSEKIPLTAVELAAIATAGGQLGIAAKDILPFVEVTAKMATAFDMTADEAGNAIGKLKNVFGLSIEEIAQFGDAINQLGNTSAAREKDIVDVLLRVGGTAKQFGLAKEQVAALAAAFLSLGKSPEVASTGINALLNRMQTATMQAKPFHEALKKIGTNAETMADAVAKNPQKALENLLETLSKLEGREKAEVLTGLFGAEYQDDIAVLVGSLQTYRDTMAQVANANSFAGAMQKEFEARASTTANQLILLKNEIVKIATNIGTGLLPAISEGSKLMTSLLKPVADLTGQFPKFSAVIVGFGTGAIVFSTVAKAVGIMRSAFTVFGVEAISSLGRVGTAATAFGTVMKFVTGRIAAPLLVGWEIGGMLNTFDVVQRAGIAMAAGLTKSWLRAKIAWKELTNQDTTALVQELNEADRIFGEMFAEVGKKAKETATVQIDQQKKVTAAVEGSTNRQKQVTGEALEAMKKKYKEYSDEIKRLQAELLGEEISLDQQLRNLKREGMSDDAAYKDKIREIREYMTVVQAAESAAQMAIKKGDLSGATENIKTMKQFAEQAKSVAGGLATEIKNGDSTILKQADGIEAKMKLLGEAGGKVIDSIKLQQEALNSARNDLVEKSGFQDLTKGLDEYEKKWNEDWLQMQAKSIEAVDAVEERIEKMVEKDRTIYINVKEREAKSSGGPIGYQRGGLIAALRMAGGGTVTAFRNMLAGGHFPGFGGGDRRHVIAEDGEYMLDKFRVRDAGLNTVRAFHAGRYDIVAAELLRKLGSDASASIRRRVGGMINSIPDIPAIGPQYMAAGGPVVGGGDTMTIKFDFGPGRQVQGVFSAADARQIRREFERIDRGRSR